MASRWAAGEKPTNTSAISTEFPLEPATLLDLAVSAYLIGKDAESFATLIRAHQAFVQRGDRRQAGGVAARLASISMSMGDGQAAGWIARDRRWSAAMSLMPKRNSRKQRTSGSGSAIPI